MYVKKCTIFRKKCLTILYTRVYYIYDSKGMEKYGYAIM